MTTTHFDPAGSPLALAGTALANDLCGFLEESNSDDAPLLCAFAREFFTKVPRHLADERSLDDVAALTQGAFRFLQEARSGLSVQVVDPEEEGWAAPVTVVRAVVEDRPFVVDSIREYLSAQNLSIRNFIHPIVGVERNAEGEIVRIGDVADATP